MLLYTNKLFIESPYLMEQDTGAGHALLVQIGEKHHRLVCRSTLYCIYIVFILYYCISGLQARTRCVYGSPFLFHLKTITATTFNTFQVCECLLGSSPSFNHNMTAPNFKSSSIQPKIGENCRMLISCLHATFINK